MVEVKKLHSCGSFSLCAASVDSCAHPENTLPLPLHTKVLNQSCTKQTMARLLTHNSFVLRSLIGKGCTVPAVAIAKGEVVHPLGDGLKIPARLLRSNPPATAA
eukprot:3370904-Pleurochrysis_carterae.AAC.2